MVRGVIRATFVQQCQGADGPYVSRKAQDSREMLVELVDYRSIRPSQEGSCSSQSLDEELLIKQGKLSNL